MSDYVDAYKGVNAWTHMSKYLAAASPSFPHACAAAVEHACQAPTAFCCPLRTGMSMFTTKNGLYERARSKFKIQDGMKLFSYPFYKQRRKDLQVNHDCGRGTITYHAQLEYSLFQPHQQHIPVPNTDSLYWPRPICCARLARHPAVYFLWPGQQCAPPTRPNQSQSLTMQQPGPWPAAPHPTPPVQQGMSCAPLLPFLNATVPHLYCCGHAAGLLCTDLQRGTEQQSSTRACSHRRAAQDGPAAAPLYTQH